MARKDPNAYGRLDLAFTREARDWARFSADAEKARRYAIRKLGRSLPVSWRRDIQQEINLKAADIRERIDVRVQGDSVLLIGRKRPIGLINFGGKWPAQTRTGAARRQSPPASAKVYRNQPRRTYAGAFIAQGRSGNVQIFKRKGNRRLPIRALYGPSMPGLFRNVARQARQFEVAAGIYEKELARVRKFV
jgi:hypothetical protein